MKKLLCGLLAYALAATAICASYAPAAAQADPFASSSDNVSAPCRRWVAVTPSDTVDLPEIPKALYIGGAGDVAMIGVASPAGASAVAWRAAFAGMILPVRPRRILATGTTATFIVACLG